MSLESPDFPKMSKIKLKKEYIIGGILLILAIIPSIYFYTRYKEAQSRLANPTQFANDEAKKLVAAVATLMTLPSDETPTVATVNDKEKLKDQPFFANTENGDKVLIYTNAKKAILYRPSINKIIDVAPVNIGPAATGSAQLAPSATPAIAKTKIVLRNGTSVVGLTKKFETELMAIVKNVEVTDRDNAKKKDYEKSLIIDIKGDKSAEVAQLAKELNLIISELPEGEATPASDFLVILGSDKK
jgi:hypothetical protein